MVSLTWTQRIGGRNNGVLAGLDSKTGQILYLSFIKHERISDYKDAVSSIEERGYKIKGLIIDGFQQLFSEYSDYKIQMCQFHMKQIIKRYLTQNPRLLAARALNEQMRNLTTTDKNDFIRKYETWKQE